MTQSNIYIISGNITELFTTCDICPTHIIISVELETISSVTASALDKVRNSIKWNKHTSQQSLPFCQKHDRADLSVGNTTELTFLSETELTFLSETQQSWHFYQKFKRADLSVRNAHRSLEKNLIFRQNI